MPLYETVFIARQDISTQQVDTLTEQMSGFITDGEGAVSKVENWGLRNLSYKVKKNRKGHYVLMNIDAPVGAVKEMERNMLLNEDILRHMTIRVEELEEGDSVMLQSKSTRSSRRDSEDGNDAPSEKPADKPAEKPAEAAPAATEETSEKGEE